MTKKQMVNFASTRLCQYFTKLFFPQEFKQADFSAFTSKAMEEERRVHSRLEAYMYKGKSMSERFGYFLLKCDTQELHFLILHDLKRPPRPEIAALELLSLCERHFGRAVKS